LFFEDVSDREPFDRKHSEASSPQRHLSFDEGIHRQL